MYTFFIKVIPLLINQQILFLIFLSTETLAYTGFEPVIAGLLVSYKNKVEISHLFESRNRIFLPSHNSSVCSSEFEIIFQLHILHFKKEIIGPADLD
jgi:hypothetical protein